MKVIILQHLSGAVTYAPKDEIDVSDLEALRLIDAGIAKAKTPKQHTDLVEKVKKEQEEEAEKTAKLLAIQKEDELKGEANALLENMVAIVTTLGANDAEYPGEFLKIIQEKFKKGE